MEHVISKLPEKHKKELDSIKQKIETSQTQHFKDFRDKYVSQKLEQSTKEQTIDTQKYEKEALDAAAIAYYKHQSGWFSMLYAYYENQFSVLFFAITLITIIIFAILSFTTEGNLQIVSICIASIGRICWLGFFFTFLSSLNII